MMDIARTQGDLNGVSEAKKAHPDMTADQLRQTDAYKAEMAKYGTGSSLQRDYRPQRGGDQNYTRSYTHQILAFKGCARTQADNKIDNIFDFIGFFG